jgi:hypothetical protein
MVDAWFLQSFDAPNLECLRVHYDFDSVPSFLRRFRCQLQTLKLHCCCKAYAPLLAVLQHVPTLSHLEIAFDQNPWYGGNAESHKHDPRADHDTLLPQFFAAMTVTGTNSLCPKLS